MISKKQFEWAGNSYDAWRAVADNLLFASVVLAEKIESPPPENNDGPARLSTHARLFNIDLMLRAMALECLLKAVWVKQGNQIVKHGKFSKVVGAGGHDLAGLARAVGMPAEKADIDILSRLTHFIEYAGRYPIPKRSETLRLIASPRGGRSSATGWTTPEDGDRFNAIVVRLCQMLD